MSGHSKWNNIKRKKEKTDGAKAAIFTKMAREIAVAVKEGGGPDPANNGKLRDVVAKAKANNVPNDNIARAIKKASDEDKANYESIMYEGYGPSGVAVIVETLTDNRNRTAPNVRHLFDKYNGNLGAAGCVSWSFDRKGVIVIDNEEGELDEDTVMMDALEAGADDLKNEGDVFTVYTDPDVFNEVNAALEAKGYTFVSAQIEMVPQNYVKLTSEQDIKNMTRLIELLEEDDDVQNVWHNWEQDSEG